MGRSRSRCAGARLVRRRHPGLSGRRLDAGSISDFPHDRSAQATMLRAPSATTVSPMFEVRIHGRGGQGVVTAAELRSREPIEEPDALIVQDPTLVHQVDLFSGVGGDAYLLFNTSKSLEELGLEG